MGILRKIWELFISNLYVDLHIISEEKLREAEVYSDTVLDRMPYESTLKAESKLTSS